MKILLINSVYNKGSTGNIVKSLYEGYKEYGHDTFVIYGRGDRSYLKDDHKEEENNKIKPYFILCIFYIKW